MLVIFKVYLIIENHYVLDVLWYENKVSILSWNIMYSYKWEINKLNINSKQDINNMQNNMNSDRSTNTPIGLSSAFPTQRWASSTFDELKIFNFPTDNQWQYTFTTSNDNARVSLNHVFLRRNRERKTSFRTE